MDAKTEQLYALVSQAVSAGDGVQYDMVAPAPRALQRFPVTFTGGGVGVSAPQGTWLDYLVKTNNRIHSVSNSVASGGSTAAIQITLGAAPSGIVGLIQGVPFQISAAGELSGSPTSQASTASYEIRKVLVTVAFTSFFASSVPLACGVVQFVYGSAMRTSANAVTSGSQEASYWDYVPLPKCSANQVAIGWLTIPNSYTTSQGIPNSWMKTDYRVTQGLDLSAMLQGLQQP